jgi:flagellar motor protein MotB
MNARYVLPLVALAALAVAPGCQNRRARKSVATPMAAAPAPTYMPPPVMPDTATKGDVAMVDGKVDSLSSDIAQLNEKLDRIASRPAPMATPMPMPAPMPEYQPVAPPAPSSDAEAARFADTLRSRGVGQVEQRGGMVMVRLSDAFRPGSDNLKGDVGLAKTLQAVSEGLQLSPGARVQVVGHSDLKPIKKSHWENNTVLSRARAQTVARVLSENGVRSYIDVDGRGESEPLVSPEASKADEAQNRRVEIHVSFS